MEQDAGTVSKKKRRKLSFIKALLSEKELGSNPIKSAFFTKENSSTRGPFLSIVSGLANPHSQINTHNLGCIVTLLIVTNVFL